MVRAIVNTKNTNPVTSAANGASAGDASGKEWSGRKQAYEAAMQISWALKWPDCPHPSIEEIIEEIRKQFAPICEQRDELLAIMKDCYKDRRYSSLKIKLEIAIANAERGSK